MKNRKLRSWVKYFLLILVLFALLKVNNFLENDFVKNCEELGYSNNYCIEHS